jgi:hypothetical protein
MSKHAYLSMRLPIEPTVARRLVTTWSEDTTAVIYPHHGASYRPRLSLSRRPGRPSVDPLQLFARPGLLRVGPWPVSVQLECTAWSDTESELGLRPAHLRWPVGTRAYGQAADAVLSAVARSLIGAEQGAPQRRVLAPAPAPSGFSTTITARPSLGGRSPVGRVKDLVGHPS